MVRRRPGTVIRRASQDAARGRHLHPEPEVRPFIALMWLSVPAGLGSHWLWGRELPAAAVVAEVMALATAGLFALTAAHAREREQLQRWQAATSVGLTGINLTQLHVFGVGRVPLGVAGALCVFVPVAWVVFRSNVVRGWGQDDHAGTGGWQQLTQGTVLGKAKRDGARTEFDGRILDPTAGTVEDLQKNLPPVLDVATNGPVGGHRIIQDPDHAAQFKLVQVSEDVLRRPIPWPGLGRVPRSITEPIPVGRYEDDLEATVFLPERHMLIQGMTDAGKTNGALIVLTFVLVCDDALLHFIDTVKGAQTPKVIRDHADLFIGDNAAAHAYLAALRRLTKTRVKIMGDAGYEKWTRECWTQLGIPHIVVWIEEMAEVVSESDDIVRLAEQVRSAGITLVLSGQRHSGDNIPTSARSQFGNGWCFGVKNQIDATFILADAVIDAGGDPSRWENHKPGYSILQARDTPRDRWPQPLRTYLGNRTAFAETITAGAAYRPPRLDGAQAAALGPLYEQQVPPSLPQEAPMPDLEITTPLTPEEDAIDPRARIEPGPDTTWSGEPFDPKELSREELIEKFGHLLAELEDERVNISSDTGRVVVTMEEILPRWPYRTRPWIVRALQYYVKAGQIRRLDGPRFESAQWEIVALVRPEVPA